MRLINAFTLLHFLHNGGSSSFRHYYIPPSLGGYIVVKENVTSSGEVERDEEDR